MPITVSLDPARCQGHGLCYMHCPEVFGSDDQAFAVLLRQPRDDEAASVRSAVESCPERAIEMATSNS